MFQELVANSEKTWMVNFYKNTCPHCHKIEPVFLDFVASNAERQDIEFGMFDCIGKMDFCTQFPLQHCPALVVFKDHQDLPTECPYEVDWTLEDLNSCLDV